MKNASLIELDVELNSDVDCDSEIRTVDRLSTNDPVPVVGRSCFYVGSKVDRLKRTTIQLMSPHVVGDKGNSAGIDARHNTSPAIRISVHARKTRIDCSE